jgi:hypothetical protein
MDLLADFLLRLAFGLAAGMSLVSSRQVSSGYYRNHLYVTLGLSALAALVAHAVGAGAWPWAVGAATASYFGSVAWLYEKPRLGKALLVVVASLALTGSVLLGFRMDGAAEGSLLGPLSRAVSGCTLGVTTAAMLLGHWYLNSPGMQLAPLRRLIVIGAFVVAVLAVLSGAGLWRESSLRSIEFQETLFLALRWTFGILGPLLLFGMAWRTLEIPNTQSATGILYVAVIGVFVGETTALLLATHARNPL